MRPAEISDETIIQAGQDLQAAGRKVTGFALRQKVGGGNPSRLKQIWDEHVASLSLTNADPVAELPIEVAEELTAVTIALTDRINKLAAEMNNSAVKAAERRVSEVVRAASEQREHAERELADAAQTVDELEIKLEENKGIAEALNLRLTEVLATAQGQAVELAQVRERLVATEQATQAANEQHFAELARTNEMLDAERGRHQQEANQLRETIDTQARAGEAQRCELAATNAKVDALLHQSAEQTKRASDDAKRAAEHLTRMETERDAARDEAGVAREEAAKLRGQVDALQTQLTEINRVFLARAPSENARCPEAVS